MNRHAESATASRVGGMLLNLLAVLGAGCLVLVVLAMTMNISLIMFKTGSMSPTIPQGSLALVREVPAAEVERGDVVTVEREGLLPVTHRVTGVSGTGTERILTLRGDANESDDPLPYTVTTVREVLWSAPGLARVVVAMSHPAAMGAITLGAAVLVGWAFWPRRERQATDDLGAEVVSLPTSAPIPGR